MNPWEKIATFLNTPIFEIEIEIEERPVIKHWPRYDEEFEDIRRPRVSQWDVVRAKEDVQRFIRSLQWEVDMGRMAAKDAVTRRHAVIAVYRQLENELINYDEFRMALRKLKVN